MENKVPEKATLHDEIARINAVLHEEEEAASGDESYVVSDDESLANEGALAASAWTNAQNGLLSEKLQQSNLGQCLEIEDSELPANTETCLALNRAYQEIIAENLKKVEMVLAHNSERQAILNAEIEDEDSAGMKPKESRGPKLQGVLRPYFRDSSGMNPPANEDVLMKRISKDRDPYPRLAKILTAEDKRKITEAVRKDAIKKMTVPLMNRMEIEHQKLKVCADEEEKEDINTRILQTKQEIAATKRKPDAVLFGEIEDSNKIDWLKISATDLQGQISEENLERVWKTSMHPKVNKSKWTSAEDQKLAELVLNYQETEWENIAKDLDTSRSAFMCLQRWKTKLDPKVKMSLKWSPEEDQILLDVVDMLRVNNAIPWEDVAEKMEGRSVEQCLRRFDDLQTGGKTGKFTIDEDVKLAVAVHCYGYREWNKTKDLLPGRTGDQCRDRFLNSLSPSLKLGEWTYEEDRTLIKCVQQYGKLWMKILPFLPGRTDNMALQRYKRLVKWKEEVDQTMKYPSNLQDEMMSKTSSKSPAPSKVRDALAKVKKSAALKQQMGLVEDTFHVTPGRRKATETYLRKLNQNKLLKTQEHLLKEVYLCKLDLEQGLYIPRPTTFRSVTGAGTTAHFRSLIDHRQRLYETVHERVKGVLWEGLRPQDNLGKEIKSIIDKNRSQPRLRTDPLLRMLNIALKSCGKKNHHRLALQRHHERINAEIMQVLAPKSRLPKKGRPRKFTRDEDISPGEAWLVERRLLYGELNDSAADIGAVMMKAMNVSYEDTARRAILERLRLETQARAKGKKGKAVSIPAHLQVFEQIAHAEKHFLLNPDATPYDALREAMKTHPEVHETIRRFPYMGEEGQKMYSMPPWPPNITNLEAFKSLLLSRRALVAKAGRLLLPKQEGEHAEKQQFVREHFGERAEAVATQNTASVADGHVEAASPSMATISNDNSLGPIVVTNQMAVPVNVVIKTEDDAESTRMQEQSGNQSSQENLTSQNAAAVADSTAVDDVAVVTLLDGTQISVAVVTEDEVPRCEENVLRSTTDSITLQDTPSTSAMADPPGVLTIPLPDLQPGTRVHSEVNEDGHQATLETTSEHFKSFRTESKTEAENVAEKMRNLKIDQSCFTSDLRRKLKLAGFTIEQMQQFYALLPESPHIQESVSKFEVMSDVDDEVTGERSVEAAQKTVADDVADEEATTKVLVSEQEATAKNALVALRENAEIAKIRNTHEYQMLKARFTSLFLWPAILSALPLPDKPFPCEENKPKSITRQGGRFKKTKPSVGRSWRWPSQSSKKKPDSEKKIPPQLKSVDETNKAEESPGRRGRGRPKKGDSPNPWPVFPTRVSSRKPVKRDFSQVCSAHGELSSKMKKLKAEATEDVDKVGNGENMNSGESVYVNGAGNIVVFTSGNDSVQRGDSVLTLVDQL